MTHQDTAGASPVAPQLWTVRDAVAVDLRELTHLADRVIELDECATDPLEAVPQGRASLESLSGGGPVRSHP
jgi:hypothetical protein